MAYLSGAVHRVPKGRAWAFSLSSVKSLACSDLARRDQRNFHHDTDYTHGAGRRDDLLISHHLKDERKGCGFF